MSGVRQALIDSGHFTEGPNRSVVAVVVTQDEAGTQDAIRVVLAFDMFGDLIEVHARSSITQTDIADAAKEARSTALMECISAMDSALEAVRRRLP